MNRRRKIKGMLRKMRFAGDLEKTSMVASEDNASYCWETNTIFIGKEIPDAILESCIAHEVGHSQQNHSAFRHPGTAGSVAFEADAWRRARKIIGRPWTDAEKADIKMVMKAYAKAFTMVCA